jgi:hypothetical protein
MVAQAHRARGARRLVALGAVVAFDIAAQAALLGARTGGLVVGDLVRGQQEGRDRVDERRFAAADIAGE